MQARRYDPARQRRLGGRTVGRAKSVTTAPVIDCFGLRLRRTEQATSGEVRSFSAGGSEGLTTYHCLYYKQALELKITLLSIRFKKRIIHVSMLQLD